MGMVLVEIKIDGVHALYASKKFIQITQLINCGPQLVTSACIVRLYSL